MASTSECFPQVMVPTLVGQTKLLPSKLNDPSPSSEAVYVGVEAFRRASLLSLKYPMEHGIIMDWDEITQLMEISVRDSMKVDFTSLTNGMMLTESALNPKRHREKMTQLAFEHFSVPRF